MKLTLQQPKEEALKKELEQAQAKINSLRIELAQKNAEVADFREKIDTLIKTASAELKDLKTPLKASAENLSKSLIKDFEMIQKSRENKSE